MVLPSETTKQLGLKPGTIIHIDETDAGLHLRWPVTRLAKVYIEPTSACNLNCRTCIRNIWDTPPGIMDDTTFTRVIDGLREFPLPLTVFFGGFGEPLSHPSIVDMVHRAKTLGATVELITNGTLLTEARSQALIAAGLDVLWVSLDGDTPESYADVRLGAALPDVIYNLERFRDLRQPRQRPVPELGIAFVAMKRNISNLPQLIYLAKQLHASRFLVTNVLPYTDDMRSEVLYKRLLSNGHYLASPNLASLHVPRLDADAATDQAFSQIPYPDWHVAFAGNQVTPVADRCPFIEDGAIAIGWDGSVSPCLPLLHNHSSFLNETKRFSRQYVVGNITESNLRDIWQSSEYTSFRQKVQDFEFSPCTACGGCDLSESNEEDCYGNSFPTCGGCLWAQGLIRCP